MNTSFRISTRGLIFLLAASVACPAADPRGDAPDAPPSTPEQERATFHLPPGFEIQLVAAEPEIQKPINLTFDGAGRLWVTGSEMYPWPARTDARGEAIPNFDKSFAEIASAFHVGDKAPKPSSVARDTVRVLSDFDEVGHARKIEVFADGLNIPSGVQPLPRKPGAKGDTVIVYSIPTIWRFVVEDILDPNRNVDPIFRQTVIETTDGRTIAGANAREQGAAIVLTDPTGKEVTVPKADIKSQAVSKLSLMPPIFETQILLDSFLDLISYLLGESICSSTSEVIPLGFRNDIEHDERAAPEIVAARSSAS